VDPYEQLGIEVTATIDEAEDAYRDLLRIHHPDLHHDGSPAEIAEAERRTRALNDAIEQIRSGYEPVSSAATTRHAASGAERAEPTARSTTFDTTGAPWDSYDPFADAPPASTPCPLCGAWFSRRDHLTAHVRDVHHLRLEHEPHPSRFRRSFLGARLAGLLQLSLWVLVPFNALAAGIAATLVATNIDTQMSYWVFGVAMSPTFIRLLERTEPDL
jgi:hypothetical protein